VPIKQFNFADRNRYSVLGPVFLDVRYRLVGTKIMFSPLPKAGVALRLWYVPRFAGLVNDTDTFDGFGGWTEYVVTDAAIKALQKEESDVSVLMAQKQALIARIESAAENRDAANPETVTDSQAQNTWIW
jgi:hypothetical protein